MRVWARRLVIVAAALAPWLGAGSGTARAQFGFGYGFGGMWGGGGYSNMATLNNINNRSEAAGQAAYAARARGPFGTGSGNPYQGNPNAFINNVRDTSFQDRFNASTRRSIESHVARRPDASLLAEMPPVTGPKPATPAAPIARAAIPLTSFFGPNGLLIWPTGSPTEGTLGGQREQASQSAAIVFAQVRSQGFAPVGIVTDARTKLVTYGQPALQYLRQNTTPVLADGFHSFLLGLYDALGRAATPTTPAAAPAAAPAPR